MNTPRLLIITGGSGIGKSTFVARTAEALGFEHVLETDAIRSQLRSRIEPSELPALHRSSFEPAGNSATVDWQATIEPIASGISAAIEQSRDDGTDLLVEGVHIVPGPEALSQWRETGGAACGVVLDIEEDAHQAFLEERGSHNGRDVDHYLDNFDRIREIQTELVRRSEDAGWLVIDVTNTPDPIERVASALA